MYLSDFRRNFLADQQVFIGIPAAQDAEEQILSLGFPTGGRIKNRLNFLNSGKGWILSDREESVQRLACRAFDQGLEQGLF